MLELIPLVGHLSGDAIDIMSSLGYAGIFLLMTIESAGIPIPSEIIMPYAGFMVSGKGLFSMVLVAFIGCMGTAFGSAIGYAIGSWGGKPVVDKYGGYLGLTSQKMIWAEKWFCKYGESAVIYTRLLPVVRTIVNIPAGLLGMNFFKFIGYSIIGAFPWCLALSAVGYILGKRWMSILKYTHELSLIVAILVILIILGIIVLYILLKFGVVKWQTVDRYLGFLWRI